MKKVHEILYEKNIWIILGKYRMKKKKTVFEPDFFEAAICVPKTVMFTCVSLVELFFVC